MTVVKKETIYVDPDDDITGIIDRVNSASSKIVALVLPKRAQMLHSSVNFRLLKRSADEKSKKLVIISTEPAIIKLAGYTKIHVASALNSTPQIPKVAAEVPATETIHADDDVTEVDAKKSVGELAGFKDKPQIINHEDDHIELDNIDVNTKDKESSTEKPKLNKKLKVPNIDKFRNRIIFGGAGLFVVLALLFVAFFVMPTAKITIKTENTSLETKFEFTASTTAKDYDDSKKIFPAQLKEFKKDLSDKVTATGKVDKGNKATGKVTFFNCNKDDKLGDVVRTVPAGTGISSGDKTFITQSAVTVEPSGFNGSICKSDKPSAEVSVIASTGGDVYNLSPRSYSVSGLPSMTAKDETGMSGGTSKLVTSISQADVDAIKNSLEKSSTDADKEQFISQIKTEGLYPLTETFQVAYGTVTSSPAVGEEAANGTVTLGITYTMLAIKESNLTDSVKKIQESNITTATQKVYDSGFNKAKLGQVERKSAGEALMRFTTNATIGPFLEANEIANEIKGKSAGETKEIIGDRPGISSVEVQYSPFWVYRTPNRLNKINIVFDGAGEVR